jgi:hypothetical protein
MTVMDLEVSKLLLSLKDLHDRTFIVYIEILTLHGEPVTAPLTLTSKVEPASVWFPLLDDECDPARTATTCKDSRCCHSQKQKIRG